MMTLHKTMIYSFGPLNHHYAKLKTNIRAVCDLSNKNKSTLVKCTPEDLYAFYDQTTEKYPTFNSFTPPKIISNPLTATPSFNLLKAMGLSKVSKNVDLPYQTLFPSKNQQQPQPQANQSKPNPRQGYSETSVLPFTETSAVEPYSLTESSDIWLKHLYISVADYQIVYEREKAVHRWSRWAESNKKSAEKDEWDTIIFDKLGEDEAEKMKRVEHFYSTIVPNIPNIVVIILKLLLSTVSVGKDKEAEILEDVNITRNRESISKSVTGVLLLLLKWLKTSRNPSIEMD